MTKRVSPAVAGWSIVLHFPRDVRARLAARAREIVDAPLERRYPLGEQEGECEQDERQGPELLQEEAARVELEQLAQADYRHQELADHHALHAPDDAEADAGQDLRQRGEQQDLAVELDRGRAERA